MSESPSSSEDSQAAEVGDATTTISDLREIMRTFVAERDWQQFHNAKNLSMSLTVEAGELMEHFQWLTTEEVVKGSGFNPRAVADELADVICYALSLANALDIDVSRAVNTKMRSNRQKYPIAECSGQDFRTS